MCFLFTSVGILSFHLNSRVRQIGGASETVLTAREYKEASDYNHTQILFDEWIKGAGKDGEAKREKVAKELVEAQEAHPVTSQETSVNTPGSIANLTRTLEMLSRKHEPKS
jgi:hypothetical protein